MYKLLLHCLVALLTLAGNSQAMAEPAEFFEGDTPTRFDDDRNPELPAREAIPDAQPSILIRSFELTDFAESVELGVLRSDINVIIEQHLLRRDGLFTVAALNELTSDLTAYYRNRGYILSRVIIPEQSAANGVVRLQLIVGILNAVSVSGESGYSKQTLTVPFTGQLGQPVVRPSLERALIQLSDYPGIDLTTALSPGEAPGTTQLNISVIKEKPIAASAAIDNYGNTDTSRYRFALSGQYRNPTDHADLLSGNVRVSGFSADSVSAQLDYQVPLPNLSMPGPPIIWQDTAVGIGYSLTRYQVKGEFEALNLEGGSDQFYLRTSRKLDYTRSQRVTADVTLAKKLASADQNSATLNEDNLTALSVGLRSERTDALLGGGRTLLSASITQGLGGLFGGLSGSGDAISSRDGASGEFAGGVYSVYRLDAERLQSYSGQYLSLAGSVQWSNDLLTAAEQISFGGQETVRGFPEASFSADSAVILNIEYFGLSSSVGSSLPISNIKLAAFWDMAWGWRNDAFPSENATPSAMSIGGYTSFSVLTDFQVRLDLGVPVGSNLPSDGSRYRVGFSLSRLF